MEYFDFFKDGRTKFVLYFSGIFLATFLGLYLIGLVPSEINQSENVGFFDSLELQTLEAVSSNPTYTDNSQGIVKITGESPIRIYVPQVGIDTKVLNPDTKDIVILDQYLKQGAVRYPDSALLGTGNVFLFGHSSNWEVVKNPAYKALNGIENLKEGDPIYVDSENYRYTYITKNVELVTADEAFVDFGGTENMLTLSTCNTFGQKQDRYVAQAIYQGRTTIE